MIGDSIVTARQFSGCALIVGCVLFLTGAGLYGSVRDKYGPVIFGQLVREWLRLVIEHPRLWRWGGILFIGGSLVTLAGHATLAVLLSVGLARLGLLAFALGIAVWIVNLAFRLSVDPWAGHAMAKSGLVPDLYEPLSAWIGVLFAVYTTLSFAGLAAYGAALVSTGMLPWWVGWTAIVYSLAGLGLFALTRDAPPFMHHVVPLLIGILLLLPF